MIKLFIREEYGYQDWYAELTHEEYQDLLKRWRTLRGVTCLVPVTLIIPQAKELDDERRVDPDFTHRCHIHESDDSYLEGCDYKIPEDENFWMDGRMWKENEYWPTTDWLLGEHARLINKFGVNSEQVKKLAEEFKERQDFRELTQIAKDLKKAWKD